MWRVCKNRIESKMIQNSIEVKWNLSFFLMIENSSSDAQMFDDFLSYAVLMKPFFFKCCPIHFSSSSNCKEYACCRIFINAVLPLISFSLLLSQIINNESRFSFLSDNFSLCSNINHFFIFICLKGTNYIILLFVLRIIWIYANIHIDIFWGWQPYHTIGNCCIFLIWNCTIKNGHNELIICIRHIILFLCSTILKSVSGIKSKTFVS